MGQKKKVISMNVEWGEFIKVLSNEDAGQLLKAIYAVDSGEEYVEFDNPMVTAFFSMVEQVITDNKQKRTKRSEANRENAIKRWHAPHEKPAEVIDKTDKEQTSESDQIEGQTTLSSFLLSLTKSEKPEETKTEEVIPEEPKQEEVKEEQQEEVKPEEPKSQEEKTEEPKPQEAKPKPEPKPKVFLTSYNFSDSEVVQSAFNDFLAMRIAKKKPMTERAIRCIKLKLERLSQDEYTQADILDQSTFRTWEDVYALCDGFVSSRERPKPKSNPFPMNPPVKETDTEISDEEFFAMVDSGFGEGD